MLQFDHNQSGGTRMQPKNPKVKAAVIKNAGTDRELDATEARERRVNQSIARKGVFSKEPDRIAGDTFFMRNHPIPKGKEMFPAEWQMQFVGLFYPYSVDADGKPSPLFMDMPVTVHEVSLCERKMVVMKEKGLRYTYMKPTEGEFEGRCRLEGQDPDQVKKDRAALHRKETTTKGEASA